MRIGIRKAQAGFSRGSARAHKYWKRVRVMRNGKLAWRYYYNTAKDRERYFEDQAKKLKGNRKKLKELEDLHRNKGGFWEDHPELRAARKALSELSVEYLQELLAWDDKPMIEFSTTVQDEYHNALINMEEDVDPHGKPLSAYRALEMAIKRLPPVIQEHFSGAIPNFHVDTTKDSGGHDNGYFAQNPGVLGYWANSKVPGFPNAELHIEYERCQDAAVGGGQRMWGGLMPVHVMIHEMAHAFHDHMGASGFSPKVAKSKGYTGPLWGDWVDFLDNGGDKEKPISHYATTNKKEWFTETFTAALMYPQELAMCAPGAYEWFRDFFGPDVMRPLNTDPDEIEKLRKAQLAALRAKDMDLAKNIGRQISMSTGILDMPEDDPRLKWWESEETLLGQLIREHPPGDYSRVYRHSDDQFYEMNVGGRTIYMRVGKPSSTRDTAGWTPTAGQLNDSGRVMMRSDDIKEIWSADGMPLRNDSAFWYLFQDRFQDEDQAVKKLQDKGKLVGQYLNKHLQYITERHMKVADGEDAAEVWKPGKKGAVSYEETMTPVPITEAEFFQRSGTFSYANWDMAGHAEYKAMRKEENLAKRKKLLATFLRKQPGVERDDDGNVIMQSVRKGEMPVPRMRTIRYVNDNPDGTKTVIECERSESGSSRGHYFIKDPLWRQMLTPDGQKVKSAQHLEELCRDASKLKTPVWVSVLTDAEGGMSPHYRHLEVQFDGRGQPKILGDEWRRRLKKDTPRLDDLLQESEDVSAETARPKIEADAIVPAKPLPGPRDKYTVDDPPPIGEKLIVNVPVQELGREAGWRKLMPTWRKIDKEAPMPPNTGWKGMLKGRARRYVEAGILPPDFEGNPDQIRWVRDHVEPRVREWMAKEQRPITTVLTRVIPGSKAGEVPRPPGWDRMPPGYDALPEDPDGKKRKLTKKEREYRSAGQLPAWYRGTAAQREWLKGPFRRAMDEWEETKEEGTAKELPDRYLLTAAAGSGFPGKTLVKYGAEDLIGSLRNPVTSTVPAPMEHDTLMYIHQVLNPVTGKVMSEEMRLLPPKDGSVSPLALQHIEGLQVDWNTDEVKTEGAPAFTVKVKLEVFPRVREYLGSLSMTADAEARVRAGADMLREAVERQKRDSHVVEIEDLDIANLSDAKIDGFGSVGLNPVLPNGREFVLAQHQKEVIQLAIDNGGRALAGHYMGTGKTISALSLAKIMHAKRDPENPDQKDPAAPSKTLIVAPLNTVEQWREAAADFDEGCTVVGSGANDIPVDEYLENVTAGRDTNDIVVCGPQYFTIHQERLRKAGFDGIVVDEAHQGVKNEMSQRNKALAEWNPDMKLMLLMTGTPIITSPADILEYVKLLSKGEQWAGMTRKQFIDEYLEQSSVPGELGLRKKGPQLQIKPEKRAELAAIIAQWVHVAMPKDVRGKTLPAVRIEEHKHAEMIGTQSILYGYYMGSLTDEDKARMSSGGALADDELAGLDEEAKKRVAAAKAVANCVAYKPATNEEFMTVVRKVPTGKGQFQKERVVFRTFDPDHLMERKDVPERLRKKLKGRWPTVEEVGAESIALYEMMAELREVLGGAPYAELAGRKITKKQLKAMRDAGWPKTVRNPDNGPVGIICRGSDKPRTDPAYLARVEEALRFQRRYGVMVMEGVQEINSKGREVTRRVTPDQALQLAMGEFGFDYDTAMLYLGTKPNDTVHSDVIDGANYGMPGVVVTEGLKFYSDKKGSLHLLYREEDWDLENNRPKKGAKSIMDPGMREARAMADLMMVAGNAKAEELKGHIQRFHTTTGDDGPDGPRQMVMFANSILDGCRTMEATLRSMGYRDVNEAIKGSVEFDPADDGPGNGKYFVTYIGKTYTGNRDLNAEIFKKRKDKLGRDTDTSLFVHKTEGGKAWRPYSGADSHPDIQMSQWLPEHREAIRKQFGIEAPEAFVMMSGEQRYFYGSKESGEILRQITLIGNPDKMTSKKDAALARARITKLQAQYAALVKAGATTEPPLTEQQRTIFNNCEVIVCSDAANVGLNFGNAVESVNYDTLGAPALEWQRITRSARMLPPAVEGVLLGKPVKVEKTKQVRDEEGNKVFDEHGDPEMEVVTDKKGNPIMIDATDEFGNVIRDGTGVVSRLKLMEEELFQPAPRGNPEGIVRGFEMAKAEWAVGTEIPFSQALHLVQQSARTAAENTKNPKHVAEWTAIANKAQVAANLGGNAAEAFLDEMSQTHVPGETGMVVMFDGITVPDPEAGTYDIFDGTVEGAPKGKVKERRRELTVTIEEATRKLHDTIMNHPDITDEDRKALADAGYAMSGDGVECSTFDATAVYMSIRAAEILDHVTKQREIVSARMRSQPGGAVVQDSDVTNMIIDSLSSTDRAILKAKKYLVNVRRLGVSGNMPQTITVSEEVENDEGETEKVDRQVFVGYRKEHPVQTEAAVRAMQRARQTSYEQLLFDIQNGTTFRTDMDYETTGAESVANASRGGDIQKSLRIGIRLGGRIAA